MGYNYYAIIGSGRQGTAAAYDLVRFSEADKVILADSLEGQAKQAADRINQLVGENRAIPVQLDANDTASVINLLEHYSIDAFVSGTPYAFNLGLTQAAIETRSGMTDFGGNNDVVHAQLEMSARAAQAGISVVPECGLGPGTTTTLAL